MRLRPIFFFITSTGIVVQVGPYKFTSLAIGNASDEYRLEWVGKSAYNVTQFQVTVVSIHSGTLLLTEMEVQPGEHSGTAT
jgi:hypothetical protein